jgi:hypothetical protein
VSARGEGGGGALLSLSKCLPLALTGFHCLYQAGSLSGNPPHDTRGQRSCGGKLGGSLQPTYSLETRRLYPLMSKQPFSGLVVL